MIKSEIRSSKQSPNSKFQMFETASSLKHSAGSVLNFNNSNLFRISGWKARPLLLPRYGDIWISDLS